VASADSDELEAWGRWGRERGASPEWENWIRGVGNVGAHRERSSTAAQSSGRESTSIGRRGGGGHRLGGRGAAVSSGGGRGDKGGLGERLEWLVHAAALGS
jgi:hypothetical protein